MDWLKFPAMQVPSIGLDLSKHQPQPKLFKHVEQLVRIWQLWHWSVSKVCLLSLSIHDLHWPYWYADVYVENKKHSWKKWFIKHVESSICDRAMLFAVKPSLLEFEFWFFYRVSHHYHCKVKAKIRKYVLSLMKIKLNFIILRI